MNADNLIPGIVIVFLFLAVVVFPIVGVVLAAT
jgi:nitrate reductase NapE component